MRNRSSKTLFLVLMAAALLLGCQSAPTETAEGETAESSEDKSYPAELTRIATLKPGTPIQVRTTTTLSTAAAKSGETFTASLEQPIVEGTWVIAPKGATVKGVVSRADPGGKVEGVANLTVRLTELETADGKTAGITTSSFTVRAKPTKKKDAKKVGIASGVGAAVGAIVGGGKGAAIGAGAGAGAGAAAVMTTRGDAAVIPSESVLNFKLTEPLTVQKN